MPLNLTHTISKLCTIDVFLIVVLKNSVIVIRVCIQKFSDWADETIPTPSLFVVLDRSNEINEIQFRGCVTVQHFFYCKKPLALTLLKSLVQRSVIVIEFRGHHINNALVAAYIIWGGGGGEGVN
jgi:hypothetical protein